MKVLFVNPPTTTCLHVTETGKQYIEENIGNTSFPLSKAPFEVIAKLNKIKNIEKNIILLDFEWYKNPALSKEGLVNLVVDKKPDIVLTLLASQASADTLDWLTTKLKEKLPKLKIIVGGQPIALLQEKIFKFCPNIDFALIGNADKSLPKLIKNLINGKKEFNKIEGFIYRKNEKIIKNQYKEEKLITYSKEIYEPYKELITDVVKTAKARKVYVLGLEEFTKGCPYNCNFCAATEGNKYKEKDIKKVIQILNYLYSLDVYKFYIVDLTFGVALKHRKKVLEALKKFKKQHKKFGFRCCTRADLIEKSFVNELIKVGCYEIAIGIECNEGTILNLMNKNVSPSKNIKALEILGKAGISFRLFLIEGYIGSNTLSSKRTFELLNNLQEKNYNYFIQPALNRDIIPWQKRFIEKYEKGILKRGNTNQLDFRHDCRKYDWDTNKSIRSICLLMLAYPSTELGKENKDIDLQTRNILNLPFLKDEIDISTIINFLKKLPIKNNLDKNKILSLRIDLAHYLEGIYTIEEIKDKIKSLYYDLNCDDINNEVEFCFSELKKDGLMDSFGKPNLNKTIELKNEIEIEFKNPRRKEEIFLFWNGKNKRYLYAPLNKKVIKIKTCFYKNLPEDVFEFLIFLRGVYSMGEISEKMHYLFKEKIGFKTIEKARETTSQIYQTCKKYWLCD